MHNNHQKYYCC